ncbi:prolyl-tRNA synthetase associated domain-containing protein [Candidatus Gracilibacteria bacterium]|nr:prolyl-tRNA synthetase associated domain-containing protein [Candidatus Gracilibacteria bacterium]
MNPEEFLTDNDIEFIRHEHSPLFTCEDVENHPEKIPGLLYKSLFLQDKNRSFLVIIPDSKRLDLKQFRQIAQTSSKLSFGKDDELYAKLKITPGSVSPFCILNDPDQQVEFYIDHEVCEAEIVGFHPNDNTATLELTQQAFHKFLELIPHTHTILHD